MFIKLFDKYVVVDLDLISVFKRVDLNIVLGDTKVTCQICDEIVFEIGLLLGPIFQNFFLFIDLIFQNNFSVRCRLNSSFKLLLLFWIEHLRVVLLPFLPF
jgi:hypothetical protein